MTAPTRPAIAVIGMPEVAAAIRAAGFDLLIDDTQDMAAINSAVREADSRRRQVMVVSCYPFPALTQVGQLLSALIIKGKKVLVLRSAAGDVSTPDLEGVRMVQLPATVNDIMASFGAPRRDTEAAQQVVNADLTVGVRKPAPDLEDAWAQQTDWGQPDPAPEPTAQPAPVEPAGWDAPTPASPKPDPDWDRIAAPAPQLAPAQRPAAQPAPVHQPALAHQPYAPQPHPAQQGPAHPAPAPAEPGHPQPVAADPYSGQHGYTPNPAGISGYPPVYGYPPAQPTHIASRRMRRGHRGDLLIVGAGAGGVGKTSLTAAAAERVAVNGPKDGSGEGPRVILIDGSRGQADNRKMLRASGSGIPTIYDAAITGEPARALVRPKLMNAARGMLPQLHFAAIFGPRDDQADPAVVTAEVYLEVIEFARSKADFVVLDTQIIEAADTSGLIDDMVIPLLLDDAWELMLSDSAHFKIDNANARLRKFAEAGVPRDRMAFALNRVNPDSTAAYEEIARQMSPYAAVYAGAIEHDGRIGAAFETGTIPHAMPDIARVLDTVLFRMTGLPEFDPARLPAPGAGRPSGRRWPFGPKK